jgi:hypothetical protein
MDSVEILYWQYTPKLKYEFDFGTFWTNMSSGLLTHKIKFNQLSTKKKKKKKRAGDGGYSSHITKK